MIRDGEDFVLQLLVAEIKPELLHERHGDGFATQGRVELSFTNEISIQSWRESKRKKKQNERVNWLPPMFQVQKASGARSRAHERLGTRSLHTQKREADQEKDGRGKQKKKREALENQRT